jgi:REP element-mobilizing transposase RayT
MRQQKLTRLIGYDYGSGGYFITAVVKDRLSVLGEIRNGRCLLNPFGHIVEEQWRWLHEQYLYLTMDEFVVMPNHIPGIINIADCVDNRSVGNSRDCSLQDNDPSPDHHAQQKTKSLSELIGAFNYLVRVFIDRRTSFQWRTSFYERIIRNYGELARMRDYIQESLR